MKKDDTVKEAKDREFRELLRPAKPTPKSHLKGLSPLEIKDIFDKLDTNKDGILQPEELVLACQHLGLPFSTEDSMTMGVTLLEQADLDHDHYISLEEFETYVFKKEYELQEIFDALDDDGSGEIDHYEMKVALGTLGCNVTDTDLSKMLSIVDANHDGMITYEEFRNFFLMTPYSSVISMFEFWQRSSYFDTGDGVNMPDLKKTESNRWPSFLVAGGVAGAVSRTATAPLDRIKTLMQVQTNIAGEGKLRTAISIVKSEGNGIRAFWKGNGMNVLKIAPESAMKFAVYENLKSVVCRTPDSPRPFERCVAGALAGMVASILIYPVDIIKARFITAPAGTYSTITDVCTTAVRKDGFRSLFRGLGVSLLGVAPYAGTELMMYETLKGMAAEKGFSPGPGLLLGCGMVSSTVAATLTYPFAVVRTSIF
eukprot:CFRG6218T1